MAESQTRTAGSETAGKLCSICQTTILGGETVVHCPDCSLPFHHECWEENRGCSQYGCESSPDTEKGVPAPELTSTAWGERKACPNCGKTIKGRALKCRFCGASFESRDEISTREFAEREYSGPDYLKARNQVILLFFLAASGALSIPAIIPLALLIFRGKVAETEYARLPSALKVLSFCALGVSCLLSLLLVLFIIFD